MKKRTKEQFSDGSESIGIGILICNVILGIFIIYIIVLAFGASMQVM